MTIKLLAIGKTDNKELQSLIDDYQKRLNFYIKFHFEIIPDLKKVKNLSEEQQKQKEGELILNKINSSDALILLDENGKQFSSIDFAAWLSQRQLQHNGAFVFVIGGAYGFSSAVYDRAQFKLSLSKMTFSHQMVRMIFLEQLYRAFSILKGEPYHHA